MQILSTNKNYSPAFEQKIKIVSSERIFDTLPLAELNKYNRVVKSWKVKDGLFFLKDGVTDGISACSGVYLQNGKKGYLTHIIPTGNTKGEIVENLLMAINKLTTKNVRPSGLITGGREDSPSSIATFNIIKEIFDYEKIKYSTIWGMRDKPKLYNSWTDLYSSTKDNLSVINTNVFNTNPDMKISSRKELKNVYQDVFISRNDELNFGLK